MRSTPSSRRRRLGAAAAAAFLLLASGSSIGPAIRDTSAATTFAPAPVPSFTAPESPALSAPAPAAAIQPMPESVPVTLRIPSVGAQSKLIRLGLDDQDALTVPSGTPGSPAGWYEHSPTPGETGPAVLLGHVNAEGGGPGIFADLRRLSPGDRIEIGREDGSTAVFTMLSGEQYPKDEFPTQKVYGNTAGPELRLITCDGYDPKTGHFDDNYVVYAELAR